MTGSIAHHAAKSLIFPAAGSRITAQAHSPCHGMRMHLTRVWAFAKSKPMSIDAKYDIHRISSGEELDMKRYQLWVSSLGSRVIIGSVVMNFGSDQTERVMKITARKFSYEPNEIELKRRRAGGRWS